MEETIREVGELFIGILAALFLMGIISLLLGRTEAGALRMYLTYFLEAAC